MKKEDTCNLFHNKGKKNYSMKIWNKLMWKIRKITIEKKKNNEKSVINFLRIKLAKILSIVVVIFQLPLELTFEIIYGSSHVASNFQIGSCLLTSLFQRTKSQDRLMRPNPCSLILCQWSLIIKFSCNSIWSDVI